MEQKATRTRLLSKSYPDLDKMSSIKEPASEALRPWGPSDSFQGATESHQEFLKAVDSHCGQVPLAENLSIAPNLPLQQASWRGGMLGVFKLHS